MSVGCGCLQWTTAAGVAWQLSVRCGTALKDGACGIGFMGNLACSGLWRDGQLGWPFRCGTSSEDGAHNFLGLLARQWKSSAGAEQVGEVGLRRWLGIDGDLELWSNIAHHPTTTKETEPWPGVLWRAWRGPRAW